MKTGIAVVAALAVGGIGGYLTANKLLRAQYEARVQEEVESVKAAFKRLAKRPDTKPEPPKAEVVTSSYREAVEAAKNAPEKTWAEIVEIAPEDYGMRDEYEEISLTLYRDGTVADDAGRPLTKEEVEAAVGNLLEHFDDYEYSDDAQYIRNAKRKADYEVLYDPRTYSQMLADKPYLATGL